MLPQCHILIIRSMAEVMVSVEETFIDLDSAFSDDWSGYVTPVAGDVG